MDNPRFEFIIVMNIDGVDPLGGIFEMNVIKKIITRPRVAIFLFVIALSFITSAITGVAPPNGGDPW